MQTLDPSLGKDRIRSTSQPSPGCSTAHTQGAGFEGVARTKINFDPRSGITAQLVNTFS